MSKAIKAIVFGIVNVIISFVYAYIFYGMANATLKDPKLAQVLAFGLGSLVFLIFTLYDRLDDKLDEIKYKL